jgi:hypothetical protein
VVLTRHPLAIFSSFANSFFDGDWERAHDFNPLLERYVPAIGRFVRERPVPLCHVKYEEVVAAPERELERVFAYMGVENEPEAVNYGERFKADKGPGDPISVNQHSRPVTDSLHKWAAELASDGKKRALAERMVERLSDEDLATWGWPRDHIFDALASVGAAAPPRPVLNSYTLQRKVLLALKKDIHERSARRAGEAHPLLLRRAPSGVARELFALLARAIVCASWVRRSSPRASTMS